jgi:hypothetical protein
MPNARGIMQKTEMVAVLPCRHGLADGAVTTHSYGCWIEPDCLPFLALGGFLKALFLRQQTGCTTIFAAVNSGKPLKTVR